MQNPSDLPIGLTGILLNWSRSENVRKILDQWQHGGVVSEAFVWNNCSSEVISHPWARVLNANGDFGLYSRFALAALARTSAVLIHDDDLDIPAPQLRRLYDHWNADPNILHGIFGRAPTRAGLYAIPIDRREAEVPIVLTRALIAPQSAFARFFALANKLEEIQRDSLPHGNGEDIILSYAVRNATHRLNRVHPIAVVELPAANPIHKRNGWDRHVTHRSCVMAACEAWLSKQS